MVVLQRALFILILGVASASAAELPSRKAGLWDLSTKLPEGRTVSMQQCVDAKTDAALQAMSTNAQRACSKRDVQKSGDTITIDSVCTIAGITRTAHAVITGSFDSSYTMVLTSQGEGTTTTRITTMAAKWVGPCAADQKPGDMIMANGMKINILDMGNMARRLAPAAPPPNR